MLSGSSVAQCSCTQTIELPPASASGAFSSSRTLAPSSAAAMAVLAPAPPKPTTTTSYSAAQSTVDSKGAGTSSARHGRGGQDADPGEGCGAAGDEVAAREGSACVVMVVWSFLYGCAAGATVRIGREAVGTSVRAGTLGADAVFVSQHASGRSVARPIKDVGSPR